MNDEAFFLSLVPITKLLPLIYEHLSATRQEYVSVGDRLDRTYFIGEPSKFNSYAATPIYDHPPDSVDTAIWEALAELEAGRAA